MDFQQGLRNVFDLFDIGHRETLKNIEVVERAPVDMSKGQERNSQVGLGANLDIAAGIGDVGTEIIGREHDAFGFAGSPRGVDDRSELGGKDLRDTLTVGRDFIWAGSQNEGFVVEKLGGRGGGSVGNNNLL